MNILTVLDAHKKQFFNNQFTENYKKYFFGNRQVRADLLNKLHLSGYQWSEKVNGRTKCTALENNTANAILWGYMQSLFLDLTGETINL